MKNNKAQKKVGILGFGEVGQAIAKFYKKPLIKDLKRKDDFSGVQILHVCIPWNDKFISTALKEIKSTNPELVIIHSTIIPGTTKKIAKAISKRINVVHSPIRGIHPYLYEGVKTFVKYIGADSQEAGKAAQSHLESLGIKTKVFYPSSTTELGKLLDTSYYGVCIAWHAEMAEMCKKFGVNFEAAVRDFNKTYNEGYAKLGMPQVVRPVLFSPRGGIGGHCIVPNAKILKKYFKNKKGLDLILKYQTK